MSGQRRLTLSNRQGRRTLDLRLLRRIVRMLLDDLLRVRQFDLGIYFVGAEEITRLNQTFLQHKGPTDVITFDYAQPAEGEERRAPVLRGGAKKAQRQKLPSSRGPASPPRQPELLYAEIFVCLDEALAQARRFRTSWQSELTRYVVHALLHLLGHKHEQAAAHRKMKRAEDRLLRQLARRFDLAKLSPPT